MANKVRVWKTEELQQFNLVDCSERPLPLKNEVEVKCKKCQSVGLIKFSVLRSKMITYNKPWVCKECLNKDNSERGKSLVGEKNPFFGKHHTKDTRAVMKKSSRKRWDNTPEEERNRIGRVIRDSFLEAYNIQNPMNVEFIKENWRKRIEELYSDKEFLLNKIEKTKTTNMAKYGVEFIPMLQHVKLSHQTEDAKRKRKKTIIDKYGSEHFFTSECFQNLKKNNDWSTSSQELEIRDFVRSFGLTADKHYVNNHEIDVFIPELNLGIEYGGLYWHCELTKPDDYHYKKFLIAKENNIQLIQIFGHEWERKSHILSRIRSLIGKNDIKIGARSCDIRLVNKSEAVEFINKNHTQTAPMNIIQAIGLYHNHNLVALASFGAHHRQAGVLVLNRFCCAANTTVSGGLSRLSKFASEYFDKDIISWCDLRWSDGNGYVKAGWEEDGILSPDYFYTNWRKVFSKQSRKKSNVKTPDGMTEHEHALLDGLFRIYDCGKIRFIYRKKKK